MLHDPEPRLRRGAFQGLKSLHKRPFASASSGCSVASAAALPLCHCQSMSLGWAQRMEQVLIRDRASRAGVFCRLERIRIARRCHWLLPSRAAFTDLPELNDSVTSKNTCLGRRQIWRCFLSPFSSCHCFFCFTVRRPWTPIDTFPTF
jgi:hypothetical protein